MSYKEQRELENLPRQIEAMEARQANLNVVINGADFYKQDAETVKNCWPKPVAGIGVGSLYQRWNELDAMAS